MKADEEQPDERRKTNDEGRMAEITGRSVGPITNYQLLITFYFFGVPVAAGTVVGPGVAVVPNSLSHGYKV